LNTAQKQQAGKKPKVILAEDENDIREYLESQFLEGGFEVLALGDGSAVVETARGFKPDIIVLDNHMPGRSGLELIKDIRSELVLSHIPIMMVTGVDGESERVEAFNEGADDFVAKPFSIQELLARANAILRRCQNNPIIANSKLTYKNVRVDLGTHQVFVDDQEVSFTHTEYFILVELIKARGLVVSRAKIREGSLESYQHSDRTIDVHLASVRKKLGAVANEIQTVRGIGFRLKV
jgi:DNA-binding response OmpR family regulator